MQKIMTNELGIEKKIDACFQRHFNHITPGTPRWHELEEFKADLKFIIFNKPQAVLAKAEPEGENE